MTGSAPAVRLRAISPIFNTTDLSRWVAHYRALGFTVQAHDEGYAFAFTGDVELHVTVNPDHDPATTAGCAYVAVDDPDAVYAAWSSVDHGGRDVAPRTTDYGTREGAHIDPDNNMLRFGAENG